MFSCCHAAASPETEEVFAPSLLEGYASSKASKEVQSGYAAPAAFGFKDRTPGIPHVVLSTKFREHWTEVSKQVKTELEKLGVTVYNPNVDNEMMYGKDEGDARWLRTFQDNLKQVKETKGFVLQIQQGANREKTHMQVAEQDMSMWLGVPRIAIYVLACNDLEYFQRTPDHFDSPYWTHVFEVAMEKAQAQWSTKMKEDLEMANELLEPLEGTELPMKDGLVHGKARSTYADGGIYVGDFEENLKHGRGKMTEPDGTSYDGQWVNDQRHGSGVIRGGNGHTYEGEWANNQQHGSGLHRFANGDSYEGEFAHDQRHGRGLYCYVNGDVDAQLAEESRPKDVGVRRLAGGGYQKLQNGAVVKEVTEKEAKQLVKENGLPSLW